MPREDIFGRKRVHGSHHFHVLFISDNYSSSARDTRSWEIKFSGKLRKEEHRYSNTSEKN